MTHNLDQLRYVVSSCQHMAPTGNVQNWGWDVSSQVSRLGGGLFGRPAIRKDHRALLNFQAKPAVEPRNPPSKFIVQDSSAKIGPEFFKSVASHVAEESKPDAFEGVTVMGFTVSPPGV